MLGRLLDVVRRARGRVVEHDLLGDAAAHRVGELVLQLVAGDGVLVVERQHHRVAEGLAAREDRDLRDGVGVVHRRRRERVTALVVRRDELLLVLHHAGAALRAGDHAVDGLIERAVVDQLRVRARGEKGGLVQHVGEVGTGEAGRLAGDDLEVDAVGERLAAAVHLEDLGATLEVGRVDADLTVEAARAQQRRVEDVGAVGRRDHDDVDLGVEAVHLDEHLVERLLALVVTAAHAGAAMAADRVDLVDEDDGRGVVLGGVEQVAHAAGADADEHLDEVRARDRVERHARLAGDGTREQRLARSGRAVQQHALRDARAHGLELRRVLQEVLDLFELFDRLVGARDVLEGDLRHLLRHELGPRLAELHDLAAAALGAGHQEPEQQTQQQDRQEEREEPVEPGRARHRVVEAVLRVGRR